MPELVVMAAGIGRRYGGSKQIDPIGPGDESLLDYSLYDAIQAGFRTFTIIVSREIEEAIRTRVDAHLGQAYDTRIVVQAMNDLPEGFAVPTTRQIPWGTGHAVLSCRNVVTSPFAVINADDFYGRLSFKRLYDYLAGDEIREHSETFCMIGYQLGNTLTEHGSVSRGICTLDAKGYLQGVDERTRIERRGDAIRWTEDGQNWTEIADEMTVSMNMWGFTPTIFTELDRFFAAFLETRTSEFLEEEFMLPDVVNSLLDEGRATVKVLPTAERWFGVTYQEDKEPISRAILRMIQEGVYPEVLWTEN